MVQINNPEIIKNLIKEAKISLEEVGKVPNQLAEKIIAVLNINVAPEKLIQVKNINAIDSALQIIHTTHATKTTYIIGATISISKDVVNDGVQSGINATPFGRAAVSLVSIRYEPITAMSDITLFTPFIFPIKLAKSSNITLINGTATASIDSTATIFFYEVDE
ncbi:hypothetical protein ES703_92500 [subsurface metagenome]